MTGQAGNLYCYVKDRIKLGTFAFVRLFVKLGLDKACPQSVGTLPTLARLPGRCPAPYPAKLRTDECLRPGQHFGQHRAIDRVSCAPLAKASPGQLHFFPESQIIANSQAAVRVSFARGLSDAFLQVFLDPLCLLSLVHIAWCFHLQSSPCKHFGRHPLCFWNGLDTVSKQFQIGNLSHSFA